MTQINAAKLTSCNFVVVVIVVVYGKAVLDSLWSLRWVVVVMLFIGKVCQTVYGHYDVVTCVARSECNISQDCYVVTGSKDCSVMVWHWNSKQQCILGDNGSRSSERVSLALNAFPVGTLIIFFYDDFKCASDE